uniref:Uncharacterized protein n=1 Tax=Ficedula albicollis TaxID=59894 RepID=A0A803VEU9_FICAL
MSLPVEILMLNIPQGHNIYPHSRKANFSIKPLQLWSSGSVETACMSTSLLSTSGDTPHSRHSAILCCKPIKLNSHTAQSG